MIHEDRDKEWMLYLRAVWISEQLRAGEDQPTIAATSNLSHCCYMREFGEDKENSSNKPVSQICPVKPAAQTQPYVPALVSVLSRWYFHNNYRSIFRSMMRIGVKITLKVDARRSVRA